MNENSKIEEILDAAIDRLMLGESISDILKEYPEYADELDLLLNSAESLKSAPAPESEDSIESLMKIVSTMSEERQEKQSNTIPFRRKNILLRMVASFAIIIFVGWGSVYASSETVPGDFLYPLKLITEKVRFILSVNQENKLELRIAFSNERLKELVKKYNTGGGLDKALLQQMLDEAKAALNDSKNIDNHIQPIINKRITDLTHLQMKTMQELEKKASPEDQRILKQSINRCGELMQCCMQNMPKKGRDGMNNMNRCPMDSNWR